MSEHPILEVWLNLIIGKFSSFLFDIFLRMGDLGLDCIREPTVIISDYIHGFRLASSNALGSLLECVFLNSGFGFSTKLMCAGFWSLTCCQSLAL